MMITRNVSLFVSLALAAACGGTEAHTPHTPQPPTPPTPASTTYSLELTMNGLADLDDGAYEGWLIYGKEKVSTGVFKAGAGVTMKTDRDPAAADKFVVTIEPTPDADPGPSGIIVLVGDIGASGANLAFPVNLATASGGFILKTPTDDDADNDAAGVWFVEITASGPAAGLMVPALPKGWVYEGWAVTQGRPLSTGRFTSASGVDMSAAFSGPNGGPPFPGEDFLRSLPAGVTAPVNLADGRSKIVLTVEPDLAGVDPTGASPFALKPLAAAVPARLAGGQFTQLGAGPVVTVDGRVSFGPLVTP